MDTTDTVEDFDVTFAVQYWNAIDAGDPRTNANATDAATDKNAIMTWYVYIFYERGAGLVPLFCVDK